MTYINGKTYTILFTRVHIQSDRCSSLTKMEENSTESKVEVYFFAVNHGQPARHTSWNFSWSHSHKHNSIMRVFQFSLCPSLLAAILMSKNLKHLIPSLGVRLVLYYKSCDVFCLIFNDFLVKIGGETTNNFT